MQQELTQPNDFAVPQKWTHPCKSTIRQYNFFQKGDKKRVAEIAAGMDFEDGHVTITSILSSHDTKTVCDKGNTVAANHPNTLCFRQHGR